MKRVAVVAPDFPPSTLPSALRLRFVTPHLRDFGWEPTVITVRPAYYETEIDPDSVRLLPPELKVIRTSALPPWLMRRVGIGDIGLRALWPHWRALTTLCQSGAIDLLFISVPPSYQMLLGRLIYERFGIPYVVDYQDPWTTQYHGRFSVGNRPGGSKWAIAYALAKRVEPFALRYVSHITAVSQRTADEVRAKYSWLDRVPTSEIPLGGERADFDYVRRYPLVNDIFDRSDGLFHVSYVGRGGMDMLPALRALFEAIALGRRRAPESFSRLRVHFVGTTYAPRAEGLYQVLPLAQEVGVADIVDEHPPRVGYLQSIQLLLDSHAVLAVGSELPHYTASKIFPLILSGRPVLALFHRSSTAVSMLHNAGAGDVITFDEQQPPETHVEEISCSLERLLTSGDQERTVEESVFARYTARAMAARLAHVFDETLGTVGTVAPPRTPIPPVRSADP